jgi:hypothetical protein
MRVLNTDIILVKGRSGTTNIRPTPVYLGWGILATLINVCSGHLVRRLTSIRDDWNSTRRQCFTRRPLMVALKQVSHSLSPSSISWFSPGLMLRWASTSVCRSKNYSTPSTLHILGFFLLHFLVRSDLQLLTAGGKLYWVFVPAPHGRRSTPIVIKLRFKIRRFEMKSSRAKFWIEDCFNN